MKKTSLIFMFILQFGFFAFSQFTPKTGDCINIATIEEEYFFRKSKDLIEVKIVLQNKCDYPVSFLFESDKLVLPNVSCNGEKHCGFSFDLFDSTGKCILPELDYIGAEKGKHRFQVVNKKKGVVKYKLFKGKKHPNPVERKQLYIIKPKSCSAENEYIIFLYFSDGYPNIMKGEYLVRINYKYCYNGAKTFKNGSNAIDKELGWETSSKNIKLIVR